MRHAVIIAASALALSACAQEDETRQAETPVAEGDMETAEGGAGIPSAQAGNASPAPLPANADAPAATDVDQTAPPSSADPAAIGEQYQDYVGGEQD